MAGTLFTVFTPTFNRAEFLARAYESLCLLTFRHFEWLIIDSTNNSHGRFQGTATVTVDGVTTTNPFVVDATDGDRLTPTTDDHITITIYAPGADPATTSPLYKASGSITKGNAVRIR